MKFELSYVKNKTTKAVVLESLNNIIIFLELNANNNKARKFQGDLEDLEKAVKTGTFKKNKKIVAKRATIATL